MDIFSSHLQAESLKVTIFKEKRYIKIKINIKLNAFIVKHFRNWTYLNEELIPKQRNIGNAWEREIEKSKHKEMEWKIERVREGKIERERRMAL